MAESHPTAMVIDLPAPSGTLKLRHVDQLIATLLDKSDANDLNTIGARSIRFDLSEVKWIDLSALAVLVLSMERLAQGGAQIRLRLPPRDAPDVRQSINYHASTSERLWSFLQRWNVFGAIRDHVGNPQNILGPAQAPLLDYDTVYRPAVTSIASNHEVELQGLGLLAMTAIKHEVVEVNEYFARLDSKILLNTLCLYLGWDRSVARKFLWRTIGEGVSNSLAHSQGSHTYVILRKDAKKLHLAIGDDGRGIPASVRTLFVRTAGGKPDDADVINFYTSEQMVTQGRDVSADPKLAVETNAPDSDAERIARATEAGISGVPHRHGYGLFFLKQHVIEHGGELVIRSGKACVTYAGSLDPTKTETGLPMSPGTVMRVVLPLA